MITLSVGLIAALAWGIHDFCVRQVSQSTGIFASVFAVLFFGCLITLPISGFAWDTALGAREFSLAVAGGISYGIGALALYKAFSIGPIRLVAPIIGAYPILSIAWAVFQGQPITPLQWIATFLVVLGVGYVAASSDQDPLISNQREAVLWSLLAGPGFAVTFALGQAASANGGELALIGPTRFVALLTVVIIGLALRAPLWPKRGQFHILALMGVLDAFALGVVISAGRMNNPEFASVSASTFGLITVVLAAIFLKERMSMLQWFAVFLVFGSIATLAL